ncbi:MAG TPA: thioesterase family protein [Spirochaetota bacterium]|nr:thioesterase family protein [Spirochaetota bacterium]
MLFKYKKTVRLYHCDILGVIFFSNIYLFFHDCLEEWLSAKGQTLKTILRTADFMLPIVHSEADYYLPIKVGDVITVHIVSFITQTHSFKVKYEVYNNENRLCAGGSTVHVAVSRQNRSKIKLPAVLKKILY